jgi:hypothetical protein
MEPTRTDDPLVADGWIRSGGGIVGIRDAHPACVRFELKSGDELVFWDGNREHDRSFDLEYKEN